MPLFCSDQFGWEEMTSAVTRACHALSREAGLPKELVLYCARHDYGTRVLTRTGNLAAVMTTMEHRDVKTAMHYQHPALEIVRAALDYDREHEGMTRL
jgi:site-specific recombinase XerD